MPPLRDEELVRIVDASLAAATSRARTADGGSWLACHPGCTPCCHGVFRISALDADRLRSALANLRALDSARADAIQTRAQSLIDTLSPTFPGDVSTGVLNPEEDFNWDTFADLPETDAPCPVLDPETGRCELYAGRPLTCRVFGPPVRNESGIGMCELCYIGATDAQIFHGEMHLAHHDFEAELNQTYPPEETLIIWAVRRNAHL